MKRLQFFKNDDEPISIIPREIRKVPKSIEEIVRSTKFNKAEIRILYKGFKQECPSGAVTEREFQSIYSHFFPNGLCQSYGSFLFRLLDRRKRTFFTFEDYVETLSLLVRGSTREKLQWIFRFYDVNDRGKLTKKSFEIILKSLYDLLGTNKCIHEPVNDETLRKHAASLFEKLDARQIGEIDFDQFETFCLRNEEILRTIDLLSTSAV